MQISPIPSSSWSNPAAASQQASSEQRAAAGGTHAPSGPREVIVDVERSSETLDRDANGQYHGSSGNPQHDEPRSDDPPDGQSMLDLPAENDADGSALDLIG
jgi:hypothetical protein